MHNLLHEVMGHPADHEMVAEARMVNGDLIMAGFLVVSSVASLITKEDEIIVYITGRWNISLSPRTSPTQHVLDGMHQYQVRTGVRCGGLLAEIHRHA